LRKRKSAETKYFFTANTWTFSRATSTPSNPIRANRKMAAPSLLCVSARNDVVANGQSRRPMLIRIGHFYPDGVDMGTTYPHPINPPA
jgi:hypothetical protein